MKASIWHNPRCSKSREALAILQATPGVEVEIVDYLKTPPSRAELEALFAKAGVTPAQALRKGEAVVKEIASIRTAIRHTSCNDIAPDPDRATDRDHGKGRGHCPAARKGA